jgi:hypothetical protein
MRTLRKRLDSVEAWAVFQQHRELQRQFQGRSRDEKSFFIIHGYWPENATIFFRTDLSSRCEGSRRILTTENLWRSRRPRVWADHPPLEPIAN